MKRYILCLLMALSAVFCAHGAGAAGLTDIPENWEYSVYNEYAQVFCGPYQGEDCIAMICDTSAEKKATNARLYTDPFSAEETVVARIRMLVGEETTGRIQINQDTTHIDLLSIYGNSISVGDQTAQVPLNTFFDLDIAINKSSKSVTVWVDSSYAFTAEKDYNEYVFENVRIEFYNGYVNKQLYSPLYIAKFDLFTDVHYNPVSIPENGSTYVDVEMYQDITVDFHTIIPNIMNQPILLSGAELGTEEYESKDIQIEEEGTKIKLLPTDGLKEFCSYHLVIPEMEDIFGVKQERTVITFTTAPLGYEAPKCTIQYSGEETVFEGEEVEIVIDIQEGSERISALELYQNEEKIKAFNATDIVSVVAKRGKNEVFIKVCDETGGVSVSNTVVFSGIENTPPQIDMGCSNGATLELGKTVHISASDAEGPIQLMKILLNGEIVEQGAFETYDLVIPENIPMGQNTLSVEVEDQLGLKSTETIQVNILKYVTATKVNGDFSGFEDYLTTEIKNICPGIQAVSNATETSLHYITNKVFDDRGNSVVMGAESRTRGGTAWIGLPEFSDANRPTDKVIFQTDMYVSSNHTACNLILKTKDTGTWFTMVSFDGDKIIYYNGTEQRSFPLETGVWYDVSIELDLIENTYNLHIENGEQIFEDLGCNLQIDVNILATIRIEMMNRTEEPGYVCVSKFYIADQKPFPYFQSISYTNGGEASSCNSADTIVLKLGGILDPEQYKSQAVSLYAEGEKINFDEYSVENDALKLKLLYPIDENIHYRIVWEYMNENQEYSAAYEFQSDIEGFGIKDFEFKKSDGEIYFEANTVSDTPKDVLFVICAYQNNIMVDMADKIIHVNAGADTAISEYLDFTTETTYKMFIWESWENRQSVDNRIYAYPKYNL